MNTRHEHTGQKEKIPRERERKKIQRDKEREKIQRDRETENTEGQREGKYTRERERKISAHVLPAGNVMLAVAIRSQ